MVSIIFGLFFLIGIVFSIINDVDVSLGLIDSSKKAIEYIMNIVPVTCLWMGIMNIAKNSGFLNIINKLLNPILSIIFPEVDNNSECFSYIGSNIVMNMFGMGNAATPFGLKAIKELQKFNKNKDEASRSMCTFVAINTASVTIMPTTIIGIRVMYGSINATNIIPYVIITSSISCILAIIIDRILYMVMR